MHRVVVNPTVSFQSNGASRPCSQGSFYLSGLRSVVPHEDSEPNGMGKDQGAHNRDDGREAFCLASEQFSDGRRGGFF